MDKPENPAGYWKANLIVVAILLTLWFVVGFGCSIFFIENLNSIKIGKLGLGFWFAQQGSIYAFVVLVFLYAVVMDFVDRRFDLGDRS